MDATLCCYLRRFANRGGVAERPRRSSGSLSDATSAQRWATEGREPTPCRIPRGATVDGDSDRAHRGLGSDAGGPSVATRRPRPHARPGARPPGRRAPTLETGAYSPIVGHRVAPLDGMRAFAVTAVILYHANPSWAVGGYFGVDVFFVLSGS